MTASAQPTGHDGGSKPPPGALAASVSLAPSPEPAPPTPLGCAPPAPQWSSSPARLSPVTPLVDIAKALPGIVIVAVLLRTELLPRLPLPPLGLPLLLGIGVAAIALARLLRWWRLRYWFDADGDLRMDSGVIVREHRRLALSRVQSVDVDQPLLARVLGLADVRIEVAGAGDTRVRLAYLPTSAARDVRAGVLARAAGLPADVGEAPETVLHRVPTGLLIRSTVLAGVPGLIGLLLAVAGLIALTVGSGTPLILMLTILGPAVAAGRRVLQWYDFTIAQSPDGLRLRSGLVGRSSHTVPPGRVQACAVSEPLLWRTRGWRRVTMTVAGQPGGDEQSTPDTLIPVAEPELVAALIARVLPGIECQRLPWQPAPRRVRWRSPLAARTMACAVTDEVVAVRAGTFTVTTTIAAHARCQSVRITQGPWERALALASLAVDLTPGPVTLRTRVAADLAGPLAESLAAHGRRARAVEGPARWRQPAAGGPL